EPALVQDRRGGDQDVLAERDAVTNLRVRSLVLQDRDELGPLGRRIDRAEIVGAERVGDQHAIGVDDDDPAVLGRGGVVGLDVFLQRLQAGGSLRTDVGCDQEGLVLGRTGRLGTNPPLEVEDQRCLERHDDRDEDVGEGEDETAPDLRGDTYSLIARSSFAAKRNPTPRTVVMYLGLEGSSSSFFRSHEIWTSRVFVGPNQCGSQTSSMIRSRRTTSPALDMSRWRRSNSRAASSTGRPALVTVREAGSSRI